MLGLSAKPIAARARPVTTAYHAEAVEQVCKAGRALLSPRRGGPPLLRYPPARTATSQDVRFPSVLRVQIRRSLPRGGREVTQNTAAPSAIRSVPSRSVAWIPWPPGRSNRAERFSSLKPTINVPTTSATSASHRATGLSVRCACDLLNRLKVTVADARAAGCEWLHVDFEDHLRPFYFEACRFAPTNAGLVAL